MADFTKDGVTISQDSGTGSAELKLRVANPPYQEFNTKRVEFTIKNTDYSVSKELQANIKGVSIWQWGENFDNIPISVGSSPEDLTISVTGRGNILKIYDHVSDTYPVKIEGTSSVKSFKLFILEIDSENPIIDLPNGLQSEVQLDSYPNWPDSTWVSENGNIYNWRIELQLYPTEGRTGIKIAWNFGITPGPEGNNYVLEIQQSPTVIMSIDPSSVTLAADGTESLVQLSTVGTWTVE